MGRIKTAVIKRVTRELMKTHSNEFTNNFDENKKIVGNLVSTSSKRLKNTITGYVTKLVKKSKESE